MHALCWVTKWWAGQRIAVRNLFPLLKMQLLCTRVANAGMLLRPWNFQRQPTRTPMLVWPRFRLWFQANPTALRWYMINRWFTPLRRATVSNEPISARVALGHQSSSHGLTKAMLSWLSGLLWSSGLDPSFLRGILGEANCTLHSERSRIINMPTPKAAIPNRCRVSWKRQKVHVTICNAMGRWKIDFRKLVASDSKIPRSSWKEMTRNDSASLYSLYHKIFFQLYEG